LKEKQFKTFLNLCKILLMFINADYFYLDKKIFYLLLYLHVILLCFVMLYFFSYPLCNTRLDIFGIVLLKTYRFCLHNHWYVQILFWWKLMLHTNLSPIFKYCVNNFVSTSEILYFAYWYVENIRHFGCYAKPISDVDISIFFDCTCLVFVKDSRKLPIKIREILFNERKILYLPERM